MHSISTVLARNSTVNVVFKLTTPVFSIRLTFASQKSVTQHSLDRKKKTDKTKTLVLLISPKHWLADVCFVFFFLYQSFFIFFSSTQIRHRWFRSWKKRCFVRMGILTEVFLICFRLLLQNLVHCCSDWNRLFNLQDHLFFLIKPAHTSDSLSTYQQLQKPAKRLNELSLQ